MMTLAVVLVLLHNVSPHHHVQIGYKNVSHVCSIEHVHLESGVTHNDLCGKVYEFLTQNVTVSHVASLEIGFYFDVTPHVCTCHHTYMVDDDIDIEDVFWERAFLKRGPPFIA